MAIVTFSGQLTSFRGAAVLWRQLHFVKLKAATFTIPNHPCHQRLHATALSTRSRIHCPRPIFGRWSLCGIASDRLAVETFPCRESSTGLQRRFFSDPDGRGSSNKKGKNDKESGEIVFYLRNERENRIPRGNIVFSFLHTIYWSVYAKRCVEKFFALIPDQVFVDYDLGLYGFTFAMIINFGCYTYSSILVSKMAFNKNSRKVRVWFHELPWFKPSETPVDFDLGEVALDRKSGEVIYLLEKLEGDATKFRGHLPLRVRAVHYKTRWPLLLYFNDDFVIKDNKMFLQTLLFDHHSYRDEEIDSSKATARKSRTGRRKSRRR